MDINGEGVQSVSRALDLLKLVALSNREGARLQDLVNASGLSKPTVHRLLKQLIASGMLMQNSGRVYHLGAGAFELGIAATKSFPLRDLAAPILEYLSQETGDSIFLVIRSGPDSLCIDRKLGSYPVKVLTVEPGHRQPMGIGAGGLAMLSFLQEDEQETALRAIEPRLGQYPGLTVKKLRKLMAETRERGWARATDMAVPGVTGVGLPLFDVRGQPFAAVSVGAISLRMNDAKVSHAVSLLRTQIRILTETLLNTGARP